MDKIVSGVEDAGKGPVIGPMIIAGVNVKESRLKELESIGVKDSKLLTPKKREELYEKIIKIVEKYKIIIITPQEIDDAVFSQDRNLNSLEGEIMAKVMNDLKPKEVIVDCPSVNKEAFSDFLKTKLKIKTKLICEHKSERFTQVAAASILAKVTRDREVRKLKKVYGNLGSGYPADPITQKFLKENYEKYPEIFRKSWSTYKKVVKNKKQKKLNDLFN